MKSTINGIEVEFVENNETVLNLDADIENADWTKGSFDMFGIDSAAKLRDHLSSTGSSVEEFKRLPVYRRNLGSVPWFKEL